MHFKLHSESAWIAYWILSYLDSEMRDMTLSSFQNEFLKRRIEDDRTFCYCASQNIQLYTLSSDSWVRFVFYFPFYLKCIV